MISFCLTKVVCVWMMAFAVSVLFSMFTVLGQRVDLSCESACLSVETNYICTVTGFEMHILQWKITKLGDSMLITGHTFDALDPSKVGQMVAVDQDPPLPFTEYYLTNISMEDKGLTSVVVLIATPDAENYKLECGFEIFESCNVSLVGKPSQPEDLIASFDTEARSVHLSWTRPKINFRCVLGYVIYSNLTNITISIPDTLNHTLELVDGNITSCTYTASVAANDTSGRIGDWKEVLFTLNGPPARVSGISFSDLDNTSLRINWTISQTECIVSYTINTTANISPSTTATSTTVLLTKPVDDPADTTYTVSVAAVDTAGRTGEWSDVFCFSFGVPEIEQLKTTIEPNCSEDGSLELEIHVFLTTAPVSDCIPGAVYHIHYNTSTPEITNKTEYILELPKVLEGETVSLTVTPESELGVGPTLTEMIYTVPRNYCMSNVTISPSSPDSAQIPLWLIFVLALILTTALAIVIIAASLWYSWRRGKLKLRSSTSGPASTIRSHVQANSSTAQSVVGYVSPCDATGLEIRPGFARQSVSLLPTGTSAPPVYDDLLPQQVSLPTDTSAPPVYEGILNGFPPQQVSMKRKSVISERNKVVFTKNSIITDTPGYTSVLKKNDTSQSLSRPPLPPLPNDTLMENTSLEDGYSKLEHYRHSKGSFPSLLSSLPPIDLSLSHTLPHPAHSYPLPPFRRTSHPTMLVHQIPEQQENHNHD